ncbi:hypothetical protein A3H53_03835 [Candidatus Nomurabacteria bacterium RIFCSPLOWO2_02_FULL_40_10]|uniref:DUF2933 domain-containing protein n=2 Tax=Candidatus Nomuraibacteriota TaxID=1752729 RepID=A0A1F6XVX6_9BACT|nr:MAG: hypothetical protein A2642_01295 [Candidatus Nomurabacteria bacterium RIFCSPHIGHO2_01_FULL_39_10]OGI98243.1 MAG: hypothetical protein A3H53_03835 [Candidatus Nomurabacteria bacterium RIFCSPLOWO2_02_FULL_40_10]
MHNHNGKNNNSMMWMMIPCLILLGVLFLGGSKFSSSNYLWLIVVGVCVVSHIWMMFKGGHGDNNNTENKIDNSQTKNENDKSKHSGSCH